MPHSCPVEQGDHASACDIFFRGLVRKWPPRPTESPCTLCGTTYLEDKIMNLKTLATLAAAAIASSAWAAGSTDSKCGAGTCGKKETAAKKAQPAASKASEAGKKDASCAKKDASCSKKDAACSKK
jgi:hypothetical protein